MAQSYSKTTLGIWPRAREVMALYRFHRLEAKTLVTNFLDCMKAHQNVTWANRCVAKQSWKSAPVRC